MDDTKKENKWGPYAWYRFHKEAIRYPDNPCQCDINRIIDYYHKKFFKYIDCPTCCKEYRKIIYSTPLRVASREALFDWTVDVHNLINKKLGRPLMTYEQAFILWSRIIPCNPKPCHRPYLDPNAYFIRFDNFANSFY